MKNVIWLKRGITIALVVGVVLVTGMKAAVAQLADKEKKSAAYELLQAKQDTLLEEGTFSCVGVGDSAIKSYSRAVVDLLCAIGTFYNMDEEKGGVQLIYADEIDSRIEHASTTYSLESIGGMENPPAPPSKIDAFMQVETASASDSNHEEQLDFCNVDLVMDEVRIQVRKSFTDMGEAFSVSRRLTVKSEFDLMPLYSEVNVFATFMDGSIAASDGKNPYEIYKYRIETWPAVDDDANAASQGREDDKALLKLMAYHGIVPHMELMERNDKGKAVYYKLVGLDKNKLLHIADSIRYKEKARARALQELNEEIEAFKQYKASSEAGEQPTIQDTSGEASEHPKSPLENHNQLRCNCFHNICFQHHTGP